MYCICYLSLLSLLLLFFSPGKDNDEITCLMATVTRGRSWRDEIRIEYSRKIENESPSTERYLAGRKIGR